MCIIWLSCVTNLYHTATQHYKTGLALEIKVDLKETRAHEYKETTFASVKSANQYIYYVIYSV